ncbi:MAG: alpha/beta hydrolase [Clostridia bacterium]|nr:alpha/beta hydrolase [Clostridia bacterium]
MEGKGENLLFLHGYLSNKESFTRQIGYFSKYFKVIAPDMTGFGTNKMPYPYSLDDYAREIKLLLDRFDGKTNVVAHSFGARVLFELLPDERVDKIVLTGAAGVTPKRGLIYRVRVLNYKIRKKLGLNVDGLGSSDYRSLDDVMKKSFVKIVNERLEDRISQIKNDCLLLFGEFDRETPLYMAKKLNKLIVNSTLCVMEGAGHFAFVDRPETFNLIVREFLL